MQSRARRLTAGVGRQRGGRQSGTSQPARATATRGGRGVGWRCPALGHCWIPGGVGDGSVKAARPAGTAAWVEPRSRGWGSGGRRRRRRGSGSGVAELGSGGGGRDGETRLTRAGEWGDG